jgi:hypothetical protein
MTIFSHAITFPEWVTAYYFAGNAIMIVVNWRT